MNRCRVWWCTTCHQQVSPSLLSARSSFLLFNTRLFACLILLQAYALPHRRCCLLALHPPKAHPEQRGGSRHHYCHYHRGAGFLLRQPVHRDRGADPRAPGSDWLLRLEDRGHHADRGGGAGGSAPRGAHADGRQAAVVRGAVVMMI